MALSLNGDKSRTDVLFCSQNVVKLAVVMGKESPMSLQERSIVKKITYPVGYVFRSNGVMLRVVERPGVEYACNACEGCFYYQEQKTCPRSQCSAIGRTDGKNVWFVKFE